MKPYLNPTIEFFDRASVPKEIQELWQEWPDLDPQTARLIRAAVSSRDPKRLRVVWGMLAARAQLADTLRAGGNGSGR